MNIEEYCRLKSSLEARVSRSTVKAEDVMDPKIYEEVRVRKRSTQMAINIEQNIIEMPAPSQDLVHTT